MEANKSIKKTWLIFALVIGSSYALYYFNHFYSSSDLDRDLKKAAAEANSLCPVQVAENTRLDNVEVPALGTFQYNITLTNVLKTEIDTVEFRSTIEPQILSQFKTNPQSKLFRDNNVIMVSNYLDKNDDFLIKVVLTPNDYK